MKHFNLFLIFACLFTISCKTNSDKDHESKAGFKAGDICIVDGEDNTFGVVKILVINDSLAHIRIYKNHYQARPKTIDIDSLYMGSFVDEGGAGIGHIPPNRKEFDHWNPVVVASKPVTEEELEGYRIRQDQ